MRLIIALALLLSVLGCDASAQQQRPGPVTAGPSQLIDVPAGESIVLPLDYTTDDRAVWQSDGLIVPAQPTAISGRVATRRGSVSAVVQIGPRDGPFRTVAIAADPPVFGPLLVTPAEGELVRLVVSSGLGATVSGGVIRQTWITATPVPPAD